MGRTMDSSIYPGSALLDATGLCFLVLFPLAAGLPALLAIIESVFVMSGREIWKQMARFWGELFGIAVQAALAGSAALGIAAMVAGDTQARGITLVAAAAFAGFLAEVILYRACFRRWLHLSRLQHLAGTLLMLAIANVPVLAIAMLTTADGAAGGAGQDGPAHGRVLALLHSPVVQARFVHLSCACGLAAAAVLLSIGAWYLLRERNVQIARRSMTVAASFGLASSLGLVVQGSPRMHEATSVDGATTWCLWAMIAIGGYMLALFAWAFYKAARRQLQARVFLRSALLGVLLPWAAMVTGWFTMGPQRFENAWDARTMSGALVLAVVVLALGAFAVVRMLRIARDGPELLKLWPADADTSARF
jgi:cytochrome bd-type quinol oxidase subunit 1